MFPSIDFTPATVLPPNKWWHCLHPDAEASTRLWLFPSVGSGAAIWRPWAELLTGAAEIVCVCLPGRESRLDEAPYSRLHDLATAIAREVAPVSDERDVFCGHGFGALLAHEVVLRLRASQTRGPRGLVVCGARPPHLHWHGPLLHRLSVREFISAVEKHYGPIPAEFRRQPEFLELLLPALRADIEAVETYRAASAAPFEFPILALAGRSDPLVPAVAMAQWREQTTGRFELEAVPGGHFFIADNPVAAGSRVRAFLSTL